MASNKIKGLTIEIAGDTTSLNKALSGVNQKSRDLQSELREVEKLLKLDPTNTELLAQKQKLLAESVSNTKQKLDTLKNAAEQAEAQLEKGEISQEQYRALQREIIKTEGTLKNLEEAAGKSNAALSKISATADEIAKGADKVAQKTKAMSTAAAAGVVVLGTMAVKAGQTADDINTLAKQSGFSTEDIQKWNYAAERIDVSTDTIISSAKKMKKNMVSTSSDVTAAWKTLGVTIRDENTGELRNSTEVFYETIKALSEIPNETERDTLAMQLFGKSADELAGIIDDGGTALQAMGQEASDTGMILSQESLDGANAFNDGIDKLKAKSTAAFSSAGASLAKTLLPMLENLAENLAGVLQWIAQLDGNQLKIIGTILLVVAAISPLAKLIGGVSSAVSGVSKAMGFLAANPIVAVVSVIAILVTTLITLWHTNEDFRNKVIEIWTAIKEKVGAIIEAIKAFFTESIPGAIDTMVSFFAALPEKIWKKLLEAVGKLQQWRENIITWAKENLPGPIATIVSFYAELPGKLLEVGKNMIIGLWNGIKSMSTWVKDKVTSFVDNIKSWFTGKDGFDTHSPSKWAAEVGANTGQGLINGILSKAAAAKTAIKTFVGKIKQGLSAATYDASIDYMALMNQAESEGDLTKAAQLEQTRNAKIEGEGLEAIWPKTSDFAAFLDEVKALPEQIAYAVSSPEDYVETDSGEDEKTQLLQMISDAVGQALLAGLEAVGDSIYSAIPKEAALVVNGRKVALSTWGDFDSVGKGKGKIFAPSREVIASIARSVMK